MSLSLAFFRQTTKCLHDRPGPPSDPKSQPRPARLVALPPPPPRSLRLSSSGSQPAPFLPGADLGKSAGGGGCLAGPGRLTPRSACAAPLRRQRELRRSCVHRGAAAGPHARERRLPGSSSPLLRNALPRPARGASLSSPLLSSPPAPPGCRTVSLLLLGRLAVGKKGKEELLPRVGRSVGACFPRRCPAALPPPAPPPPPRPPGSVQAGRYMDRSSLLQLIHEQVREAGGQAPSGAWRGRERAGSSRQCPHRSGRGD